VSADENERAPNGSGSIARVNGAPRYVRLFLLCGTRKRLKLPKGCSEAMAEEKRAVWAGMAARGELVADPAADAEKPVPDRVGGEETVASWFRRWSALRKEKGLRAGKADASIFKIHVAPHIGRRAIASVTITEIEAIRTELDRKIRERLAWEGKGSPLSGRVEGRRPGISGKTGANAWGLLLTMFLDASRSKQRDLRMRDDNPTANLEGPDATPEKEGPHLYPSEFLTFASCAAVPLRFRRLVALAVYTYTRQGELRARRWRDVDLEHHRIAITTSIDRYTGEEGPTKTSSARTPEIEPNLLPLLEALEGDGVNRMTWMPPEEDSSTLLRKWLLVAGVDRRELHIDTPTTRKLTFHDLRHTACTWAAARGDAAFIIMAKSGHRDLATVNRYVERWGNVNRATFGDPFPVLPPCLLATSTGHSAGGASDSRTILSGSQRPQWESNPVVSKETAGKAVVSGVESTEPRKPNSSNRVALATDTGHEPPEVPYGQSDPLDDALLAALKVATAAGDVTTIAAVVSEIRERRQARAGGNVVTLDATRRRGR